VTPESVVAGVTSGVDAGVKHDADCSACQQAGPMDRARPGLIGDIPFGSYGQCVARGDLKSSQRKMRAQESRSRPTPTVAC
jgi:hypothetical protein